MNRHLKIPYVAHAHLSQKGEYWTWNQRPGFYSYQGKFYNSNLHDITRSDRIRLKIKNPHN